MVEIWIYLFVPVTSAIVGWATNWLAVKSMFYPLEFVGIPPYLGWQGVCPANGPRLADIAVDLMLDKLVTIDELFEELDVRRLTAAMKHRLDEVLEQIVNEVMQERAPTVWEMLPVWVKDIIYRQVAREAPEVIERIGEDAIVDIEEIFDLKAMLVDELLEDKALLNEIFETAGEKEFSFLIRSGLFFGFLLGIPSMLAWHFTGAWWALPVGGFFVGYGTNWLALKMIFEPLEPRRIGPFTWQGRFMRRQDEVAVTYAKVVTGKLLNAEKIADTILRGPHSDRLFAIIERHVNRAIDQYVDLAKPYVILGIGTKGYIELKHQVCDKLMAHASEPMRYAYDYADEAMDLGNLLRTKIEGLSPVEFEGILRPAYQQDEFKLILVGAILGMIAGFFQMSVLA